MTAVFELDLSELVPLDDPVFQVLAEKKNCIEDILRIVLSKPDLTVKTVRHQYSILHAKHHSVVLDALCIDKDGNRYNVEMQKSDNDDLIKRARYNASCIDTKTARKGIPYKDLKEVTVIFLMRHDYLYRRKLVTARQPVYELHCTAQESCDIINTGIKYVFANSEAKDGSTADGISRNGKRKSSRLCEAEGRI